MALMQKAQANSMRLAKQGSYGKDAQWISHTLYDTVVFPTQGYADFFTVPQSGAKSLAKTNLKSPGQLPSNQFFRFQELEYGFISPKTTAEDLANNTADFLYVMSQSWITFQIDGREFDLQIPGKELLPDVSIVAASAVSTSTLTYGMPLQGNGRKVVPKINIGKLVNFKLIHAYDPAANTALGRLQAAGCELQFRLVGSLLRRK